MNKVFVYNLTPSALADDCCLAGTVENIYYSLSPRLRSTAEYNIYNLSTVYPNPSIAGVYYFYPYIITYASGYVSRRSCFLGIDCGWIAIAQTIICDFEMTVSHNYGTYGVEDPLVMSNSVEFYTPILDWAFIFEAYNNYSAYALGRMAPLSVCVNSVFHEFVNTSVNPDVTLTIDCD